MDIQSELLRWNVEIHSVKENTLIIKCQFPGHADNNPSCVVNQVDDDKGAGYFFCPVCQKGGSFYKLLSLASGIPADAFKDNYEGSSRTINVRKVEMWHAQLCKSGMITAASQAAKRELERRGISEESLRKYHIGWDIEQKALMIPIRWGDRFVNVRRYRPGGTPKFSHYAKGYGKLNTLFPQDQLTYKKIVICGGEVKALAVAQRMNQYGIGAVSSCTGELNWNLSLSVWLDGKEKVWACYDVDPAGIAAGNKTCAMIKTRSQWVGNIKLPLDPGIHPKGDVNDYFGKAGYDENDFLALLDETEEWDSSVLRDDEIGQEGSNEVKLSSLCGFSEAFNFSTTAYISGVDDSVAHKVAKSMTVTCTNDADVCSLCKLQRTPGFIPNEGMSIDVDGRDVATLRVIGVDQQRQNEGWKHFFGIPLKCHKYTFIPSKELLTVRYALLSDTEADTDTPIAANVITDGGELHYGEVCHIEGRADQSPLTTEEVRIVTSHSPRDILSEYRVDDFQNLERFRPADPSLQSLERKMDSICSDLERNVTYIYGRSEMHVLFDLAFHSPLWVPFKNSIEPGWVSVLIVSETAQGKSTIMRRLLKHYGYGAYIDAANTTIAGLIGGVKTVGKRQFLKWGVLPQNDKRLVCIEEYANAPVELLRAMRAARDSGVVKLDKIDKGAAKARTRTIVLSNPKRVIQNGVVVDGLTLLEELVQRPEDLRRFDIGMWVPRFDEDVEEFEYDASPPVYSADASHQLLTWAWTIPPESIRFTENALKAIKTSADDMTGEFPYLYLIGGREFESKLARLSAALATRVFSEEEGWLVVHSSHVLWMVNFLRELYSDGEFGYSSRILNEAHRDEACTVDSIVHVFQEASSPHVLSQFCFRYNRYSTDDLRAAVGDQYAFERVYQQLLIMGCLVPESEGRWNNHFMPTRRFKKLLPKVAESFQGYTEPPGYM